MQLHSFIHSGDLVRAYPCKEDPAHHFPSRRRRTISNVARTEWGGGGHAGTETSRLPETQYASSLVFALDCSRNTTSI
jgi:hypothetical protein